MNIRRILLKDCYENMEHSWEILIDEISDKGLKKAFVVLAIQECEYNDLSRFIESSFDKINISCEFYLPYNDISPVMQVNNGVKLYHSSNADFIVTVGAAAMNNVVNSICILATNSQYLNKLYIENQDNDKCLKLAVYYNNLKHSLITK